MSSIEPFRGRLVDPAWADAVVSPAYDSLSLAERTRIRAERPDSYLHVTRSADDEPDGHLVDAQTLVDRGRASLERLLEKQAFRPPRPPAFHVYRLATPGHSQIGLVGEVDPHYFALKAMPHEATQIKRATMLAQHFLGVGAASSPIACTVRDSGALEDDLRTASQGVPVLDFTLADGLRQTIWRVDDADLEARLRSRVDGVEMYIIDGHHRAAASRDLVDRGHALPVLVTVFPARSLHLEGFHRLMQLPEGFSESALMELIARRFAVVPSATAPAVDPGGVVIRADARWHRVRFDERPIAGSALVHLGALDPSVFEREIVGAVAARTGRAVDITYVPAGQSFEELLDEAARTRRVPALLAPVDLEDVFAAADAGLVMPAKSTYFTPKVRSGIFLRKY